MLKWFSLLAMVCLMCSCTDEFNLPEYEGIDDNESPEIELISPLENAKITGTTEINIQVNFSDDYQLNEISYQLAPLNFNDPGLSFSKTVTDSMFSIDTTYTIPSSDSIQYDVLIIANDLLENVVTKSYQFTSK